MGLKSNLLVLGTLAATSYSYFNLHKDIYVSSRAVEKTISDVNRNFVKVIRQDDATQERLLKLEEKIKDQQQVIEALLENASRRQARKRSQEQKKSEESSSSAESTPVQNEVNQTSDTVPPTEQSDTPQQNNEQTTEITEQK
ncbi:sucrose-phosphate synthase [Acrasis kona]|uniref:Sucrose-phosphate synthase n=1 Tax=Acrasis kona TaxID=1008807 RepID=A0AAW2ZJI4_9EUKA